MPYIFFKKCIKWKNEKYENIVFFYSLSFVYEGESSSAYLIDDLISFKELGFGERVELTDPFLSVAEGTEEFFGFVAVIFVENFESYKTF